MIGERTERSRSDVRAQRTGGVGQDQHFGPEQRSEANSEDDLVGVEALIAVQATLEEEDRSVFQGPDHPGDVLVALDCGNGKRQEIGEG